MSHNSPSPRTSNSRYLSSGGAATAPPPSHITPQRCLLQKHFNPQKIFEFRKKNFKNLKNVLKSSKILIVQCCHSGFDVFKTIYSVSIVPTRCQKESLHRAKLDLSNVDAGYSRKICYVNSVTQEFNYRQSLISNF